MPNTPGPDGYVAVWVLSVWLFALGVVLPSGPGVAGFFPVLVFVLTATAIVSVPFAAVGVVVVHVVCRQVEAQWVHVLVAGLTGYATMVVIALLGAGPEVLGSGWWLGMVTAVARAALIPLVLRRRAAAVAA